MRHLKLKQVAEPSSDAWWLLPFKFNSTYAVWRRAAQQAQPMLSRSGDDQGNGGGNEEN